MDGQIKIADLPATAKEKAVYRRSDGATFLKLNETCHVRCRLSDDRLTWLGVGCAELLAPDELVERVQ